MFTNQSKKVHFLVCSREKKLITQLQQFCKEHGIIPDFLYKRIMMYGGLPVSMWFEEQESVVDGFRDHAHYLEVEAYSNSLTAKVMSSPYPLVSTVSIERNFTKHMATICSHTFTSSVILYHPNPEKLQRQKVIFGANAALSGGRLAIVDTVEEIFKKLPLKDAVTS